MNAVVQKEAIKIKCDSHAQFLEAWDLLVKLGYNGPQENKPEIWSKHLYGRAGGHIDADYFNGNDSLDSAKDFAYFSDPSREVTMLELREMAGPLDGVEKEYPSADGASKKDVPSLGEPLPSMRQALMDLFATKMGTVFYIPFLDANDPPKQFIEMLEDIDDCNLEALQEKSNAFKGLFDNGLKVKEVAENLICELQKSNYPYLLCVETCQNIRSVRENEQGEIVGCGYSWNSRCSTWILTTELIDGVMQAKQIGDANLKRHKAKLDAELQPNV